MIERLAKDEYLAWMVRNAARKAMWEFLRIYRYDNDREFERSDAIENDDAELVVQFDVLKAERDKATKALSNVRSRLRRAVRLSLTDRGEPQ